MELVKELVKMGNKSKNEYYDPPPLRAIHRIEAVMH